jgi:hypothetical protein
MPAFVESEYRGQVIWLGHMADRAKTLRSEAREEIHLSYAGIADDSHAGLTRPACSRVRAIHTEDTEIRNTRQISILSAEELAKIATNMGMQALKPEWLGASLVIEGIPDLSHLPPSSRLQAPSGATITVDVENGPCNWPGQVISEDAPGKGKLFKAAAKGLRGVTGWVECEGILRLSDEIRLIIPTQSTWRP